MVLRKNKKTPEVRRTSGNIPNSHTTKFNYHSVRSTNDTNIGRTNKETQTELSNKTKSTWWKHIPTYIAVLVVLGSLMYTLTLSTNPTVRLVQQTNQTIVQPLSVYQQAAQNIFESSWQNKTKVTINTDKVAKEIEQKYPEINAVSIVIPLLGHRPILEIRPAQSILILSNAQGQFVINQQGNAVLQLNSSLSAKYSLPTVVDQTGFDVKVGQQALPSNSVKFIKTVVDQFGAKNLSIQSMILSSTPYELDVRVKGEGYFIKFNLLSDPLYSTGTYFATAKLFNPSNTPTQYVDVRIPGRAYYK